MYNTSYIFLDKIIDSFCRKIQGGRRTRHYQLPLVLTRELDKRERQKEKAIAIFPSSMKKILFAICPSWIIKVFLKEIARQLNLFMSKPR